MSRSASLLLRPPSFWTEARDPWAWQRALQALARLDAVPDPRPAWRTHLRDQLSRRAVPGLYGRRSTPAPARLLGIGLLHHDGQRWALTDEALTLAASDRDAFVEALAPLLVRRSPWLRLALRGLVEGSWTWADGPLPWTVGRRLTIGVDLHLPSDAMKRLLPPAELLGDQWESGRPLRVHTAAAPATLSALGGPLYLLHARGWLDASGRPTLPDELAAHLGLEPAAAALRRLTREAADDRGFVPYQPLMLALWRVLHPGRAAASLDAWADRVVGDAISRGHIEVHAWAPGQPRHGRGHGGDRDKKLVRWTIHDDFLPPADAPTGLGGGALDCVGETAK